MNNLEHALTHGWTKQESGKLVKRFEFEDFKQSIKFVNNVAKAAEKANHHPDIKIKYNKVTISLITHDAGKLTDKDYTLAKDITYIYRLLG
jgi:4a-hydroxytetrahydrobiopterin dehydratase